MGMLAMHTACCAVFRRVDVFDVGVHCVDVLNVLVPSTCFCLKTCFCLERGSVLNVLL